MIFSLQISRSTPSDTIIGDGFKACKSQIKSSWFCTNMWKHPLQFYVRKQTLLFVTSSDSLFGEIIMRGFWRRLFFISTWNCKFTLVKVTLYCMNETKITRWNINMCAQHKTCTVCVYLWLLKLKMCILHDNFLLPGIHLMK